MRICEYSCDWVFAWVSRYSRFLSFSSQVTGESDVLAVGEALPFLEYELSCPLVFKTKVLV